MKVLITGGAGFIGSMLTPMALNRGYDVTVIDSFIDNQQSLLDCCYHRNLRILRGNLEHLDYRIIKEHDAIVHLAAVVGASKCDKNKEEATKTNTTATTYLCENKKAHAKIVFTNTNSGYQATKDKTFVDENFPMTPQSHYGKTKMAAEAEVISSGGVSLRLASVFGIAPRLREDLLLNNFVHRAMKERKIELFEADYKRNFIHVRDVARCIMHMIDNDKFTGVYNIGLYDGNITKRQLAERIKRHIPGIEITETKEGKSDPDQRDFLLSYKKLAETGFSTFFTIDDGISELIKGYTALGY